MSDARSALIVGGGIGGLTAALALRQSGWSVTVLERVADYREVGAGIQMPPNATRVLADLGLHPALRPHATEPFDQVRRRWSDGRILAQMALADDVAHRYGAPYWQFHRADLHRVLREGCVEARGPRPQVQILTGSDVVAVGDPDAGSPSVTTRDGRTYSADVVIGADGIRSTVRDLLGFPDTIERTSEITYRALIPTDRLRADPRTRWVVDREQNTIWFGPGAHVVHFFVRDTRFLSVVVQKAGDDPRIADGSTVVAPAAEMVDAVDTWDSRIRTLLSLSDDDVLLQPLFHRRPDTVWTKGSAALLGDSCHAMLPYQGQGAAQAIEDAAVLAQELAAARRSQIPEALVRYQIRRAGRAALVQDASFQNERFYHLPDGPQQVARDEALRRFSGEAVVSFDWLWRGGVEPIGAEPQLPAASDGRMSDLLHAS